MQITNSDWDVVQAWVPITALDAIAGLDAVQEITPPDYCVTKRGLVNTEGDGIHHATWCELSATSPAGGEGRGDLRRR